MDNKLFWKTERLARGTCKGFTMLASLHFRPKLLQRGLGQSPAASDFVLLKEVIPNHHFFHFWKGTVVGVHPPKTLRLLLLLLLVLLLQTLRRWQRGGWARMAGSDAQCMPRWRDPRHQRCRYDDPCPARCRRDTPRTDDRS